MKNHLKRHGNYPCVKCSKSFSLKSELLSSKHPCNNAKKLICTLCGKSFKFLKRHVRAFHLKERKFKCKICPKAYTDPTPLRHHTNASHGDGSTFYDCNPCKKKFTTKRRFLEHNDKYHKETIEEKKSEVDEWAICDIILTAMPKNCQKTCACDLCIFPDFINTCSIYANFERRGCVLYMRVR